ncbi:hypothetical protein DFA_01890 [Cavenderia fasciculata]|uniref:Uncharacterized protein n=1 Tax=Cavenderia fasciculata TaxID=261658 RepID=F4PV93_CACFS|nr:uncharacterized protein DFA_01890 [Cavenderia fasciculata]EGG22001.1 hypothetical protein DFA_01890 [Cavenderia fasciculata]|eukprot:XP_004359852.1 hypothetical protein DFA_01890 [Cavenderia fasciculata]
MEININESIQLANYHHTCYGNLERVGKLVLDDTTTTTATSRLRYSKTRWPRVLVLDTDTLVVFIKVYCSSLKNIDTMDQYIRQLHIIINNNLPVSRCVSRPEMFKSLISASKANTIIKFAGRDLDDESILQLFYSILTTDEIGCIYIISSFLPYLNSINDLPIDELIDYCNFGGYPVEILVAEMFAKHIISRYDDRQLSEHYFNSVGVVNLFLKLIRYEQNNNEFSIIKKGAIIMFQHIGLESIDNADFLDKDEKKIANSLLKKHKSRLSKYIDNILINKDLPVRNIVSSGLVMFGCGMACGWRQGGGTSKHIISMGLLYSVAEMTRQFVSYHIDQRPMASDDHLKVILDASIGLPLTYMYINMLKISPIAIIPYHIGQYLYRLYCNGILTRKAQTHLRNGSAGGGSVLMNQFKQKIVGLR